mmetsp:Transcript_17234/g.51584  ORF Transcript_17234/g.51584 Transcript_17234/m.51584 type:complete len:494 (+) Transcript_17234:136-1617(+)|eukprot:CAMPEP_0206140466 /NCGR_PEP_ID=MMETSP1473-20131121/9544_1 /ASSEMBLY_ACC=CAM_ASM_001109 /TAXON_ID=1461547 /ORGANISM="Stichococcus sp, Strain RCC1054" /LENGTH=493 /DNA_ID=CAMNT_0053534623 /DNA_START=101 /DNA_END=1582 /DNA_ORIENTATION=+
MPRIVVKPTAGGNKVTVTLENPSARITELKERLSTELSCPVEQQRLIYKGQILKDEKTLSDYGIEDDHVLHFVKARPPGSSGASASAATGAASAATPAGLSPGAAGGAGGPAGMTDFMQQAMNSPMMQQMFDNPEVLRNLLQANPQISQLLESNPELAQILNDPALLRQSMQLASNPALMQQQMRQNDQAMNNIQSHPEGFNALRNMYQNLQVPMENAAAAPASEAASDNPFASLFGGGGGGGGAASVPAAAPPTSGAPNSVPMPNPWAPPASSTAAAGAGAGTMPDFAAMMGGSGGMPGAGGAQPGEAGGGNPSMTPQQAMMMSMMENPGVQQEMQQMLSNPAMLQQMLNANPQMQAALDANPAMQSMLSDPEMLRQMLNPANLRALMQMQQAMASLGGGTSGARGGGGARVQFNAADMPAVLASMGLGAGGAGGGFGMPAAPSPVADPETTYAAQIEQLEGMGFWDRQANVQALQATGGNVNAAVDRLLAS